MSALRRTKGCTLPGSATMPLAIFTGAGVAADAPAGWYSAAAASMRPGLNGEKAARESMRARPGRNRLHRRLP